LFKGYGAKVGLGNMRVKAENRMVTSGKCVSIKSGVEEKITVNFGNSQFFSESVGSFAIEN